MDDEKIIELYWARRENAISETKRKYGRYCYSIAYRILKNKEDAEECENDTYLDVWNEIPPNKPQLFSSFLGMITRRISLDRFRKHYAAKRGGGETALSLHELEECITVGKSLDEEIEERMLAKAISDFLRALSETEAAVFILRYWHFHSVTELARIFAFSESKVKMMLKRTREKLRFYLESEGFLI
ncbi:MAG: sigma-70 family RNA polymerase sigma factor [Clostridia bacterium]|nr:sigma-70 family RNA polymerase sigma factor [Clostridia bacterium]